MAWLRVDDNVPHHRKMLQAGPAASWLWLCGVAYCQRHKTDGFIPREALAWLGVPKPEPLAAALVKAGLWHAGDAGWRVHDFLEWNDSATERDAKREQKGARQAKWRQQQRRDVDASTSASRDGSTSRPRDAAPTPTPTPPPSPPPAPHPPPDGGGGGRATAPGTPPPAPADGDASPAELFVHPSAYQRLRKRNAYVGERLQVPHDKHLELLALVGGDAPDAALRGWYAQLDAELIQTKEPIAPDIWRFLDRRFAAWHGDAATAAELDAWAPGGKHDGGVQ